MAVSIETIFARARMAVIAVVVLCALLLAVTAFLPGGARVFAVVSGSMSPAIERGALVVVQPQDVYQSDDVVTFVNGRSGQIVTHRIVSVSDDGQIVTKGDANEDADVAPRRAEQMIGRVLFDVPLIGYVLMFLQTTVGFVLLVVVPATVIVYREMQVLIDAGVKRFVGRGVCADAESVQEVSCKKVRKLHKKRNRRSKKKRG